MAEPSASRVTVELAKQEQTTICVNSQLPFWPTNYDVIVLGILLPFLREYAMLKVFFGTKHHRFSSTSYACSLKNVQVEKF